MQLIFLKKKGKNLGPDVPAFAFELKAFYARKFPLQPTDTVDSKKRLFIQTTNYCSVKMCLFNFWIWKRNYTFKKNEVEESSANGNTHFQVFKCTHNFVSRWSRNSHVNAP